jgi:hypothetical protein
VENALSVERVHAKNCAINVTQNLKVHNAGGKQPTLDERPQDVGMASDQPTVSSRINI